MKKMWKTLGLLLLTAVFISGLCACDGKPESNTSANAGNHSESASQNEATSNTSTNAGNPSENTFQNEATTTNSIGNHTEELPNQEKGYPIEIKLLDEKHADFHINLEEIKSKDVDLDKVFALSCVFPSSECEIRYEGELPIGDGSDETVPPRAYAYCDAIGDFGEVSIDRESEKQFVLHLNLTEDETITSISSIFDGSETCIISYCLFDDENEYEEAYPCAEIINRSDYQSRYANETGSPEDTGEQGTGETTVSNTGDPSSISLSDFVGDYRGVNLFFVVDWETYEMSEDVDHSSLSFVKMDDGYELTSIVIDDLRAPKRHKTLDPVILHDSDMTYYLDTDVNEDDPVPWDCLIVTTDDADIIFSKWQKNGQLMITIDIGDNVPQVFIPQ